MPRTLSEYRTEAKERDDVPTWEPPVKQRLRRIVIVKRTEAEIDAAVDRMAELLPPKEESKDAEMELSCE